MASTYLDGKLQSVALVVDSVSSELLPSAEFTFVISTARDPPPRAVRFGRSGTMDKIAWQRMNTP
jgi:hypothetical protein